MQTTMIISTEKLSYKAHVGFVEYVTKKFSATVLVTPDYVFVVTDTNVISANELWHYIREVLPEVEIMNLEQSFYICVPRTTECYTGKLATCILRDDAEMKEQAQAVREAVKESKQPIDYAAETGSRVIDDLDKAIDRAIDSTNKAIAKVEFTEDRPKETKLTISIWATYQHSKLLAIHHKQGCKCNDCGFITLVDKRLERLNNHPTYCNCDECIIKNS